MLPLLFAFINYDTHRKARLWLTAVFRVGELAEEIIYHSLLSVEEKKIIIETIALELKALASREKKYQETFLAALRHCADAYEKIESWMAFDAEGQSGQ